MFSNSKTTAEDRAKRNLAKDNPFIVRPSKPQKGRKGKQFGQRIKRKSNKPTVLTLQDPTFQEDIEDKIATQSKLRNKRQVSVIYSRIHGSFYLYILCLKLQ